jgi:hypothetical protein
MPSISFLFSVGLDLLITRYPRASQLAPLHPQPAPRYLYRAAVVKMMMVMMMMMVMTDDDAHTRDRD